MIKTTDGSAEGAGVSAAAAASSSPATTTAAGDVLRRFEFVKTFFGYKFCDQRSPMVRGHPWRHPSLDIFFVHLPGDGEAHSSARLAKAAVPRLPFAHPRAQMAFGRMNFLAHECFVPQAAPLVKSSVEGEDDDESEPAKAAVTFQSDRHCLQLQQFGALRLYACAPKAARAYLTRCYGADWFDVAYRTFDHAVERKLSAQEQGRRVQLTEDMRRPAQPTGPLPVFHIG